MNRERIDIAQSTATGHSATDPFACGVLRSSSGQLETSKTRGMGIASPDLALIGACPSIVSSAPLWKVGDHGCAEPQIDGWQDVASHERAGGCQRPSRPSIAPVHEQRLARRRRDG